MAPQADLVYLYTGLEGNGRFFFDNLVLQVQAPDQTWQHVPLKNSDFEHSRTPLAGYVLDPQLKGQLPAGVVADLVAGQGMDQSQALRLTLSGNRLVKVPLPYGSNKAAGKYCQLKGVNLYYETYGTGEPLLLLHGNGESIHSFSRQIEDLAEHYHVIAVDTRAQGKSVDTLTARLTYELFADDMKALLDSLRLPKANVLGWSDGGNTGLLMALRYPTYVHKLVTMGANLYPSAETVDGKMLRQSEQAQKLLDKKGDLKNKRLLTLVLTEPHMSYAEIEAIKAPTLVLAGEKDIIKEAHSKAIAAHIPGAQVVILKGVTHYAPQENPALFNQTVLAFLAAK
ncbi:pimeloyl-ACP methyl ester carboxylesterase [Hymenobacter sp. 1B]|uniref:Pimeloyl-ACP methyl ester carboxylesterase n=1 Tax=Hymenobacter artigasi TaxID=2719616 RepID=A0ABX1HNV1_9BACT|nr:pimeloyl-ACP methyl ester carboxylesterase [Hymenobacter artigasi]